MKKKIFYSLGVIFLLAQLIRPEKNLSDDQTNAIATKYPMPDSVAAILQVACNDCHTNKTRYPWYAEVQPAAWLLSDHVKDGKRHFNMSNFASMKVAFQNHKLEEMAEEIEKGDMPLPSYTYMGLHSEAKLTPQQKQTLVTWAHAQMDSLKAHYPADSLVMPKRSQGPPPPQ
jgi:Haem-binding domain